MVGTMSTADLLDEMEDSGFNFSFSSGAMESLLQLLLSKDRRWKLKAGDEIDELLRRPKSRYRPY